ncbi:MAG TPA: HlyD family efflux transporter periplasmic adaptor subunit [Planctomycetota bacterium]|nr:HlyD family efflux transporter periplasmic adaptor subunit [Planctomycetota bacterium]
MRSSARTELGLLSLAALLAACGGSLEGTAGDLKVPVRRTDLLVTVVEGGSIESESPGKIFNEIEGQVTILKLIPEGTIVEPGEVLCELDVSGASDRRTQQEIVISQAAAARVRADNEFEIVKNQQDSLVAEATLEVQFAELDLEKYEKGDYVQARQEAEAEQTIAEEEIKRAKDRLEWSQKLEAKGFLTRTEREADELNAHKTRLDLELAKRKLEVLENYTAKKQRTQLQAELVNQRRDLERTKARAASAIAQAEADKASKEATLKLERDRFAKIVRQIEGGVIKAQHGGLVVYAREGGGMRGSERPIEEGAQVRERQAILSIPDLSRMMAKISIHESAIDRIRVGQPAVVRIDAFRNDAFPAVVSKVAGVPDSQNMWMNPDLKVYTTEVRLLRQDAERLRPGMSCSVEIHAGDLKDVLAVPLQAVRDNGIDHFCLVEEEGEPKLREVKIGLHNDKAIELREGVKEGEVVYLTFEKAPPLPSPRALVPAPAASAAPPSAAEGAPTAESSPASRPRRENRGNLSEEERRKMREGFESMSPEEREAARKRMRELRGEGTPPGGEDASPPRR